MGLLIFIIYHITLMYVMHFIFSYRECWHYSSWLVLSMYFLLFRDTIIYCRRQRDITVSQFETLKELLSFPFPTFVVLFITIIFYRKKKYTFIEMHSPGKVMSITLSRLPNLVILFQMVVCVSWMSLCFVYYR